MPGDNPNFPIVTAAINWFDTSHQLHIRVYSSDGYNVIERCNDGSGWVDGQFSEPGSQVAATTWADSAGQHIRVYVTASDQTTEWCNDPGVTGWTKGSYTTT
jgi:hypothetical protein